MPSSPFLLLGRPRAGTWLLALQLAIGVVLCLDAWQAMEASQARRSSPSGIDETNLLLVPWLQTKPGTHVDTADVLRVLRTVPGVQAATATNQAPYGNSAWSVHVWADEAPASRPLVSTYLADESFLATFGITLSRGRAFATTDYQDYTGDQQRLHADPAPVILSAALAGRLYGATDPLGRTLQMLPGKRLHVIGVIDRMPLPASAHRRDGTVLVLPVRMTRADEAHFLVRYAGNAGVVSARMHAALKGAYADAVVPAPEAVSSLRERASKDIRQRASASLAVCVAWWLLTLGMLMLGGHRWIQEHTQEFSLRRAFGATALQLARRLRCEYLLLAAIASALGACAAWTLPRLLPTWSPSAPSAASLAAIALWTIVAVQSAAAWPVRLTRRIPPHLVSRSPSVRL
ncbi:MAG: hypothetical protein C0521_03750 [Xanthomonas sp.]|nr:hypothetical protein [Xanthomonas sp.]